MHEHDVAAIVSRMFEGFALGDLGILREVLAPDCVWHISGSNILSGDHVGPEAITAMLTRARSSPGHDYRPVLLDVATSDRHAVAIYRATATRLGKVLDLDQLLLMHVEGGRIAKVTAYPRNHPSNLFTPRSPAQQYVNRTGLGYITCALKVLDPISNLCRELEHGDVRRMQFANDRDVVRAQSASHPVEDGCLVALDVDLDDVRHRKRAALHLVIERHKANIDFSLCIGMPAIVGEM